MKLTFITVDGAKYEVDGEVGLSVMECATRAQVPGIIGECGGAMACATCHAYLAEEDMAKFPPAGHQESAMIDGCIDVLSTSRLTCQLVLTRELNDLVVTTPASQI